MSTGSSKSGVQNALLGDIFELANVRRDDKKLRTWSGWSPCRNPPFVKLDKATILIEFRPKKYQTKQRLIYSAVSFSYFPRWDIDSKWLLQISSNVKVQKKRLVLQLNVRLKQ